MNNNRTGKYSVIDSSNLFCSIVAERRWEMQKSVQINDTENKLRLLMLAIILTNIITMLNTSTVTISLPTYMNVFQVDINTVQWIAVGYMLPLAMLMPLSGYLCERYSYRKVFLFSIVTIGACSLGCAYAANFHILVVFRAIKGLAGGVIVPSTMAMLYHYFPEEKRAYYLGITVLFQSVGLVIGPTIAGIILQLSKWNYMFLLNIPFVLIVLWLGYRSLPLEQGYKEGHADFMGIIQISLGTGLILFSFTKGSAWGWQSKLFFMCFMAGMVLVILFVIRQFHLEHPLLNFSILKYRSFAVAVLINCIVAMTLGINNILAQFYFQTGLKWTPAATGIFLLIPSIVMVIGNNIANILHKRGYMRSLIVGGISIALLGNLGLCQLSMESNLYFVLLCFCTRFFGISLINMPLTNYGLSAVPSELSGHASSLFNWSKQAIQVISINILTVLLNINLNRYYWDAGNVGIPVEGTMAYRFAAIQAVNTDYCYLLCFIIIALLCTFFIQPER